MPISYSGKCISCKIELVSPSVLNWDDMDRKVSGSQNLLSIFLPSLLGHGLHTVSSSKSLFHHMLSLLDGRIFSLQTEDHSYATRILLFFRSFYGS